MQDTHDVIQDTLDVIQNTRDVMQDTRDVLRIARQRRIENLARGGTSGNVHKTPHALETHDEISPAFNDAAEIRVQAVLPFRRDDLPAIFSGKYEMKV